MSYIGQGLPADTFQGFVTDSFTGDGSATTFTLSKEPFSEDTLIVVINNVIQKPTTNFTVSGTTLTIVGTAVASGDVIYAIHMGGPLPIGGASELDLNGASDKLILDEDADTTISADTDDQIDFKAGGTDIMSLTATTATFNDGVTITTADNTDTLTLTSTDADGTTGPVLNFFRNSGSPADNDNIGFIRATGKNDASQDVDYTNIYNSIVDASDGTEDGAYEIYNMVAGTLRSKVKMVPTETVFNEDSQDIDFRVESDGNTHALFVDAGNNLVGVGETGTLASQFHVSAPSGFSQYIVDFDNASSSAPYGLFINYSGAAPDSGSDYQFFECRDTGTTRFIIYSDGDTYNHDNAFNQISDQRIKQNITDANSQWDDIKALKVRNFVLKDDARVDGDKAKVQIGVVAQEAELVCPKLVTSVNPNSEHIKSSSEFGTLYEDGDEIPEGKKIGDIKEIKEQVKGFRYSVLYMKAIKALQEAQTRIETLETKVKALEDA